MVMNVKQVKSEFLPFLRVYKDGIVERLLDSPYVPPSPDGLTTDVLSKDIDIKPDISARLYLPKLLFKEEKLPILLYFHAGGFCIESAFSFISHRYASALTSRAKALIISVEYSLAPEHHLPTAYEDSWTALQWVASHTIEQQSIHKEPWLIQHGNFDRVYVGGDSSGANIAHHLAMKASVERLRGGIKIYGAILCHPFFWGSESIGSESIVDREMGLLYKTWMFAYPCAPGGIDNPMINPFAKNAPSLSGLGCSRLLVCVASKDELRERGVHYCDAVRESGWRGEGVEMFEMEGEGHIFHILDHPESENARKMINCLASFLHN